MAEGSERPSDARPGASGRPRTRKRRPPPEKQAGAASEAAPAKPSRRPGRARGIEAGAMPAPTIVADPTAGGRLGLIAEMRSAFRRDPRGFALAVLFHVLPIALWIVFFVLMFFVSLAAIQYARGRDPALELGWLSEAETRAARQPSGPIKLEGPPVETPRTTVGDTGDPDPANGNPGGGSGEAEAEPVDVSHLFDGRTDEWALAIDAAGGNDATRAAIDRGLAWLIRQQHTDGHWQFHDETKYPDGSDWVSWRTRTGATALALTAFLGAGHTHRTGRYQKSVEKGLDWLVRQQRSTGDRAGDFFDHEELGRGPHLFAHAVATIALGEAYALTGDPELREPLERAVDFLLRAQHPTDGGWGYRMLSRDESEAHLWVTGWSMMALFTARAAGIDIEQGAFRRTAKFVDSVMVDEGAAYKNRSHPGEPPQSMLRAQGLLARQYLGWERDHPALENGLAMLLAPENQPAWEAGRRDLYGWYHEAEVLHNLGGEPFEEWYARVQQLIVEHQEKGPTQSPRDISGSWHPTDPAGPPFEVSDDKFGRLYTTCMCLLILESPFRHMPVYPPEGNE